MTGAPPDKYAEVCVSRGEVLVTGGDEEGEE